MTEPHETSAGETGGREALTAEREQQIRAMADPHGPYVEIPADNFETAHAIRDLLAEVERLRDKLADAEARIEDLDGLVDDLEPACAAATQRAETAERELGEMRERVGDWEPGRWHQVRRPDGSLWMETSDREEAEAEARKQGWPLYRRWECYGSEWREVGETGSE